MEHPINVQCPFCGESFVTFVDPSLTSQNYIEDCQVCCRPIQMRFDFDEDGELSSELSRDN